ncbi:hypothetical protein MYAM1_000365 [Malassezia yamatoensis]|uniref:Uncharacterized protein n=1 Tax=Malassezia yamatoensis TaxID=253288 RepID=A0AAJ6CHB1_9BASI|nr:hypothetical protein MYAM1_000365 [Malassezia yamatoensis]
MSGVTVTLLCPGGSIGTEYRLTKDNSPVLQAVCRALNAMQFHAIYTATQKECMEIAEVLKDVSHSSKLIQIKENGSCLLEEDTSLCNADSDAESELLKGRPANLSQETAGEVEARLSKLIETLVLKWTGNTDTHSIAIIAHATTLHRILQLLVSLDGQGVNSLSTSPRRKIAVQTPILKPGAFHQVLVNKVQSSETFFQVRILTLGEAAHLHGLSTYPISPLLGAPGDSAHYIRASDQIDRSSSPKALPPVTLSYLSLYDSTPTPGRTKRTSQPDISLPTGVEPKINNATPSPSRGRTGSGLSFLPLGSRSSSSSTNPSRNLHAYDMSTMIRSIDKWDSNRSDDHYDTVQSPVHSSSRGTDPITGSKFSSPFQGGVGGTFSHGTPRANESTSSLAITSPTTAGRAAFSVSASASASSLHGSTSSAAPLLNVGAFAQSLFGHTGSSGVTESETSDATAIWQSVCVRLFPLFNYETLNTPVEAIADSVDLYVRLIFEQDPAQALAILHENLRKDVLRGLLSITNKLQGREGQALLHGLSWAWRVYYCTIVPYLQACLSPLEHRAAELSMLHQAAAQRYRSLGVFSPSELKQADCPTYDMEGVNVRRVLLLAFRDRVLLPIYEWFFYVLQNFLTLPRGNPDLSQVEAESIRKELRPYLLQLVGVLASLRTDDLAQERMEILYKSVTEIPTKTSFKPQQELSVSPLSSKDTLSPGSSLPIQSDPSPIGSDQGLGESIQI